MKSFLKKNYIYILAFIVPVFLLVLVYAIRGVYPFGKGSVLALDLNAQYIYYYEAFRDAFYEGKSLFYSFSRTLGGEMIGVYAYYLASPFSIILLLFPKTYITEAIALLILLKVGSAALTFAIYLKLSKNAKNIAILLFSIMYALMSYMIVQTLNPMWLDALILLPLIILAVERLINKGTYGLLVITLAALFIVNFYIGYMTGIFVFVYFVYYLLGKSMVFNIKDKLKKLLVFSTSTLLAIGISMWLLLPTYYSLSLGKLAFTSPSFIPVQKLDIFDMFTKMLPVTYDSVNYPGYPFIFCGTIVLLLTAFYFISKKISSKEKIASASVIALFIVSFSVSSIDLVLHGFQAPNWLNYRYSYILSFFLIILAYEAYSKLKSISKRSFAKVGLVLIFVITMIGKLNYGFIRAERNIWASFLLIFIFSLLLYLLKYTSKTRLISIIIVVVVAIEMFGNAYIMIDGAHTEVYYSDRPSYREYFDRLYPLVDYMNELDDSFYRSETVLRRTVNDPMALGINGISHSSSTLNKVVLDMLHQLGLASQEHWSRYKGTTVLTDTLLGVKYIISEKEINNLYKPLYSENDLTLYENQFALPIAYVANDNYLNIAIDSTDPFINQNLLLSSLLGEEYTEYFKLLTIKEILFENMVGSQQDGFVAYNAITPGLNAHIEYLLEPVGNNEIYMYLYSEYPRKVNIWLNTEYIDTFFDYSSTCIMPLGSHPDEETISLITTPIDGDYYLNNNMFYYLDTELFKTDIEKLKQNEITINKLSETHITINAMANENEMLFTSIPYEPGWRVTINGEKVEPIETLDSLMAFKLGIGQQDIELRFIPHGFITGSIISFISILCFVFLLVISKKKKRKISV